MSLSNSSVQNDGDHHPALSDENIDQQENSGRQSIDSSLKSCEGDHPIHIHESVEAVEDCHRQSSSGTNSRVLNDTNGSIELQDCGGQSGNSPRPPVPHQDTDISTSTQDSTVPRWSLIEEDTTSTALGSSSNISFTPGTKVKDPKSSFGITLKAIRPEISGREEEAVSAAGGAQKISIQKAFLQHWKKLTPHLASILVTALVVQLSFRNVYWMDLKSPSEDISPGLTQSGALNFLQLAAKLHELLILASISTVVLHVVQKHLTGRSGLPLGMVANSFELSSGQFLRRKSFWTLPWLVDPVTGKKFFYFRFWLLSLCATALVVFSGPASAIAIIPTLNYFTLDKPFKHSVLPYFVFNQSSELWPAILTGGSQNSPAMGSSCWDPASGALLEYCPASGFQENIAWAGSMMYVNTEKGSNISYISDVGSASTRRVIATQACNRTTTDGRASAVGLPAYLSNAFIAYWKFAQGNFAGSAVDAAQPHIDLNTNSFAPRVEVLCNAYRNTDYPIIESPNEQAPMYLPTWSNISTFPVPDWTFRYPRDLNSSNVTLFAVPYDGPETPSLGVTIIMPVIQGAQETNQSNITWYQTSENYACSIYSQWIPVKAWYEPYTSDQVEFDLEMDLGDTCLENPAVSDSGREAINTTISQEYADGINQPMALGTGIIPALLDIVQRFIFPGPERVPNGQTFGQTIFISGPNSFGQTIFVSGADGAIEQASKSRAKLLSMVLAGIITDGLARIAGDGQFPYSASMFLMPNRTAEGDLQGTFPVTTDIYGHYYGEVDSLNTTNAEDANNWLKIDFSFSRYGYGYKWTGSRITQFGVCVLLLHVTIASCHIILVLIGIFGGRRAIHRAWETIPEMFVLAMNSRPSERLKAAYSSDGTIKSWKESVAVRESNEGVLEIIVGRGDIDLTAPVRRGTGFSSLFRG
ncbi:hypothetical protein EG329_002984 [Mollisiaceae sp. DMI_Dod_QoI]|nr:hypothetical protein EG329_002984 [Helotiales sp. DMI_Dod_QoI]